MTIAVPAHYRAKGLGLAIGGLLGLWMASVEGLINVYRVVLPGHTLPDGAYPYPSDFWQMNAVLEMASFAFLALGIVAVFLAREKDEFLQQMHLRAIQFAVIAQFLVGLTTFAYFYFTPGYRLSNTFQCILTVSCGSFLLAYLLRFYGALHLDSVEQ